MPSSGDLEARTEKEGDIVEKRKVMMMMAERQYC